MIGLAEYYALQTYLCWEAVRWANTYTDQFWYAGGPSRPKLHGIAINVFFEIVRDGRLHVNVTHKHPTMAVRGWAGPASLPDGFVHNRTFGDTPPSQIVRHIRDMVFAART